MNKDIDTYLKKQLATVKFYKRQMNRANSPKALLKASKKKNRKILARKLSAMGHPSEFRSHGHELSYRIGQIDENIKKAKYAMCKDQLLTRRAQLKWALDKFIRKKKKEVQARLS